MILGGEMIRELGIITPCQKRTVFEGVTYGLGPAGYDLRVEFDGGGIRSCLTLEPGEFSLASTVELFRMPKDVLGMVHDKSTWARVGLAVQNTVIEPGWRGHLTLELTNHSKETLLIRRNIAIAQVVFHQVLGTMEYDGKYQDQERGPVKGKFHE